MTEYFISKDGNDGWEGDESNPWLTVQKAANTLIASDIVYIKEGNYNERAIPQNSGTPGNYITYTAYPEHTPTIDGTGKTWSWDGLFHIQNKNYIRVSGLRVIQSEGFGVLSRNSNQIIIENCYTYNTYESGIAARDGSSNIIIDGNEVELACNGGGQECISLSGVDTFEVSNNIVHRTGPEDVGGEGIDAKAGCKNGKIYKNHVYDLTELGIYVDAWNVLTQNIDIYQNTVHDCTLGIVIASEQGGTINNINIYNNIAYNNQYSGVEIAPWHVGGPMNNIKIINNTLYNNSSKGIWMHHTNVQNVVIRNNICSQNANQIVAASLENVTVDHNLIDGPTEVYGTDYITGDPKFVNPVVDFHLQSDSPAINVGSSASAPSYDYDEIRRPVGTGYDIGAYEYALLGTISGIVIDKSTGLPISGVKINADGYETTTE